MKTRTLIRNVHRKPIGPSVGWNELTEECKQELAKFVKETVTNEMLVTDGAQSQGSGNQG